MKIPEKIQIIGKTLTIKMLSDQEINGDWGCTNWDTNTIKINKNICKEQQKITLLHEITHWMFHSIGEKELRYNEKLTDSFSELLYQIIIQLEDEK